MSNGNSGNEPNLPEIDDFVLKIVVVGESGCGKTTFIRAMVRECSPGPETSINGVRIYSCEITECDVTRTVNFYEIPSDPIFSFRQGIPYYEKADIVVFMYAIDDPSSLEKLSNRWISKIIDIVTFNSKAAALLGNKRDLFSDPQVINRLALNNQTPVAPEKTEGLIPAEVRRSFVMEISSLDYDDILDAFESIRALLFSRNLDSICKRCI